MAEETGNDTNGAPALGRRSGGQARRRRLSHRRWLGSYAQERRSLEQKLRRLSKSYVDGLLEENNYESEAQLQLPFLPGQHSRLLLRYALGAARPELIRTAHREPVLERAS